MNARAQILGVERRRKWSPAEKAQFLEEALQPGVTVASVADKHGISRGLFYYWMAKARAGLLPGVTVSLEIANKRITSIFMRRSAEIRTAPSGGRTLKCTS